MIPLLAAPASAYVPPELVCDVCAFTTLRAAAASVGPGEVRHFDVLAGTYVESDGVRILEGRTVTFTAIGAVTVTRALPVVGPVFEVTGTASDPAVLALTGFSLTAIGERAVHATWGDVELTDCVLFTIGIVEEGGVVFADRSTLRVERSLFLESTATTQGGHVLARDTTLTVVDTEFRGGFARFGGSVAVQSLDLVDETATLDGARFSDNLAAEAGGALSVRGGVVLTIDGAVFERNVAPIGGAVSDAVQGVGELPPPVITVVRSTFEDNDADASGGALANAVARTTVSDSTFRGNTAGSGGAVWVGGGTVDFAGSLLCDNEAERGGALTSLTPDAQTWDNLRLVENEATLEGGAVYHQGGRLSLRQGNLLGNVAPAGGALLTNAVVELRSSLFAHTGPARAVDLLGPYAGVELWGNAWWQNAGGDVDGFPDVIPGEVQDQDPLLVRYVPGLGCDAVNDYYSWYGPLRDAAGAGVDRDGSPADIGAYGGTGSSDPPWLDADGDGFPALYDCLEGDETFHPDDGTSGPVEIWYDDLDQDCRGDDDFDRDGDGWQPPEDCNDNEATVNPGARDEGNLDLDCELGVDGDGDGYAPPGDCDDTDPDINPGEAEDKDPTVDRDCVGPSDIVRGLVPAPCSTAPGPAGASAVLLALVGVRRRRHKKERALAPEGAAPVGCRPPARETGEITSRCARGASCPA